MKETINGWIARDKYHFGSTTFFSEKPQFISNSYWDSPWDSVKSSYKLEKQFGLKPGQIKKAKLTIEVT